MKLNKSTAIAGSLVLAAGIAAILLIQQQGGTDRQSPDRDKAAQTRTKASASGSDESNASPTGRSRTRAVSKDQELVMKYGESRTNLSRHVSNNVISILDDAVQMGDLMISGQSGAFGGRNTLGMALGALNQKLALTEEQKDKAAGLLTDFRKRQQEETKKAVAQLKKDPTTLMKLILGSDANARGEITDEEYKRLQAESGKELKGIINPLDRRNFGGASPLRDPAFLADFKSVLDPEQGKKLEESMTANPETYQALNTGDTNSSSINTLPKMELEKIDATIESARKVTTGIRSMMEGMGGLKDLATPPADNPPK